VSNERDQYVKRFRRQSDEMTAGYEPPLVDSEDELAEAKDLL
jgi:hypothetical protein